MPHVHTVIERRYLWGFLLSEQELRRIHQCCLEHIARVGQTRDRREFKVQLRDGSVLIEKDLDGVLALENTGAKSIVAIDWWYAEDAPETAWSIRIRFRTPDSPFMRNSIQLRVAGASREWVLLCTGELEDRLTRTRRRNPLSLLDVPWVFPIVSIVVAFIAMLSILAIIRPASAEALKAEIANGNVRDALQGLVFLEERRGRFPSDVPTVFGAAVALAVVGTALLAFLRRTWPSYVFYTGDGVTTHDRRARLASTLFVGLGLAVIASILAGLLLKLF